MKKVMICLLLVLFLVSCTEGHVETPGFVFYFPNENSAEFVHMPFENEGLEFYDIVEAYCSAQPPKNALFAIPSQWQLKAASCADGVAGISFEGTQVSALQTNTAAACLLQTVLQLPEIDTLQLALPQDETLRLTQEDLLLSDSSMLPQKESIALYVPDGAGRFLLHQTQTVEAVDAADKPRYIVQRLLETASTCIPQGTKLLNISVEHGICTVDLSSAFLHNMHPEFHCERMAVYAIVNSLTELDEINTVEFWIEGAPLEELKFMKLTSALAHDESLLAPTETNALDALIYASCDGKSLVKVPMSITSTEKKTVEETILDALLSFTQLDGAKRFIPEGTKRLSVKREGSNCIVDLTGEFLHGCKDAVQESLSVKSVVATMCAIEGISSVEILVEGLEPAYRTVGLEKYTAVQAEWLAEK